MRASTLASFILTLVAGGGLAAQDSWTRVFPTVQVSARTLFAVAYDSGRGVVVMFGGTISDAIDETWEYDGVTWAQNKTKTVPTRRNSAGMAYDSDRGVVVMFGGRGPAGGLRDTWEYDGKDWTSRGSLGGDDDRVEPVMAYDAARKVVVRFGGIKGKPQNDTWEWDGKQWTFRGNGGPPPRSGTRMVYDSLRQRVVLYGGQDPNGFRNDVWEWDGNSWLPIVPKVPGPKTSQHAMAYHPVIGRVVLTGGGNKQSDTWSYDGKNWLLHSPKGNPGDNNGSDMVYDSNRNVIVLVRGAKPETWEYTAPLKTPAAVNAFGTGCAGKTGTPELKFGLLPYAGSTTSLEMVSLPSSVFATPFLFIGTSKIMWGTSKLPFDLASAGASGCKLYVSPDLLLALVNTGGSARIQSRIPLNVGLVGVTVYAQGFVADSTANALGAAISNAVEGKIGQRW